MMRIIGLTLIVLGVLASVPSLTKTFLHVEDPTYAVSGFMLEGTEEVEPVRAQTHARYHAFRECLLATAVLATIVGLRFAARGPADRRSWSLALLLVAGYTLGWWLPWPLFDLRAPHAVAETAHAISTLCLGFGVWLTKPDAN